MVINYIKKSTLIGNEKIILHMTLHKATYMKFHIIHISFYYQLEITFILFCEE